MSTKTKKQHYVWENYLQAWALDRQIWCLRSGRTFKTSTENVAQERYFYEIKIPTASEIRLIERLLNHGNEISRATNLHTFYTYLLTANSGNDARRFGIEWHHGIIETRCQPILQKLVTGDDSPLKSKEEKINLAIFMGQQYTRTKKIRNSFLWTGDTKVPEEYKNCDFQKIYEILSFIYANNIGAMIAEGLDLRLMENSSKTSLITSDQPVYNLLATPGSPASDVEIYYPISPKFALLAKNKKNHKGLHYNIDAVKLNSFVAKSAYEFIFATSEAELKEAFKSVSCP